MTIRITEDETEAGGYALIDLGRPLRMPLLSLRRQDVEPRHLGAEGWQPEVAWLAPLSVTERDGRAVARFGPNVVGRIEELVPIEIVAQDGTSFGVVAWPFITPAPAGPGILVAPPPPEPAPIKVEMTGPAPLPVGEPTPPEPEPEPPPPPKPRPGLPRPEPIAPSRRVWPMIALPLVVLAAIGGAYLYRDELSAWLGTRAPATAAPPVIAAAPTPAPAPAPEAPRPTAAELRQRYTRLIEERAAPAAFVAFGETALAARQGAAAFRAFEEADPAASADAAWQLARFYDPGTTDGAYRDAARPDTARAAYYYALWRSRSPRHTDALRGLCEANADLAGRDDRLRAFCRP